MLDPEALSVWLPPGDMTGTIQQFDPRPGGSYRMVLTYPDGSTTTGKTTSDTDVVEAHFVELVPDTRIVYAVGFVSDDHAYDGTMFMTWEIAAVAGGSRVEVTADNVPDIVPEADHAAGMESSLAKLAEYLSR